MSDNPIGLTEAPDGYSRWLAELKTRIQAAQIVRQ